MAGLLSVLPVGLGSFDFFFDWVRVSLVVRFQLLVLVVIVVMVRSPYLCPDFLIRFLRFRLLRYMGLCLVVDQVV